MCSHILHVVDLLYIVKDMHKIISTHSLHYHGHMNTTTCMYIHHTSLYTQNKQSMRAQKIMWAIFEYYLPTLRVTVVVFPCQEHM